MDNLPVLAGIASTVIFAGSTLPMLVKARRTRDLSSYSLGNILLANLGNAVHSVYVFSLEPGPLWALHGFYLTSTGLMLAWFVKYQVLSKGQSAETSAAAHLAAEALHAGGHRPLGDRQVRAVGVDRLQPAQ
jgi:hypothetical protein